MPDHKRQHYVPRFYLKRFTDNEKVINLYNWKAGRAIFKASLKEQCYRDYFYGADGKMESEFADLEGKLNEYFKLMHKFGATPRPGSSDHDALLFWIVLQSARTPYAADMLNEMTDQMMKAVLSMRHDVTQEMLDAVRIKHNDPVKAAIAYKAPSYPLLRDMHFKLVVCPSGTEFLASDTPVASHNQLMRFRSHIGSTTGLTWKGLQIFYPISWRLMLMLYDPGVYVVGTKNDPWLFITDKRDVDELNVFQAAHSYENIYFRSGASNFLQVVERAKKLRRKAKSTTRETEPHREPGGGFSNIVATTIQDVQMDMQLSFVRLNKPAKAWIAEAKKQKMMPAVVPRNATIIQEHNAMKEHRAQMEKDRS